MATYTFRGDLLLIEVDNEPGEAFSSFTVTDLYSRWKDWVKAGSAQYPPAFAESVGGNPTGDNEKIDAFIFLRNDLGWRIRPAERDHTLRIDGNLFGADINIPVFTETLGGFTVPIELKLSSRATVIETTTSGLTAAESSALLQAAADAAIAKAMQTHFAAMADGARITDPATGKVRVIIPGGDPDNPAHIYREADVFEDATRLIAYRGQGLQAQDEMTAP